MELTPTERAYVAAAEAGNDVLTEYLRARVDAEAAALEDRLRAPGQKLAAAIWYATAIGIPVFPVRPADKQPATLHGFKDATTVEQTIKEWWQLWPEANPAYPTGILFDVIDVDGPEGVHGIGQLRALGKLPPIIAAATTPRGFHYYIRPTGEGNTTNLLPSVDYRGAGGYVLAPPSWYGGAPAGPRSPEKPAGFYRWTDPLTVDKLKG
jgi:Bifunctional DNA primase/polymerase, N-terminal